VSFAPPLLSLSLSLSVLENRVVLEIDEGGFCVDRKDKKKLNSHRWAFNAFCPQLLPNVCVLIDVGTKPEPDSIYKLWKAFDRDPKVGGACGEITVDTGRACSNLINPLVAAQNFEYKVSSLSLSPASLSHRQGEKRKKKKKITIALFLVFPFLDEQ
jgi:cellulose synthase/poly-beta-1,6-N-acetylglucosamine synthase-like glycosyltransferase